MTFHVKVLLIIFLALNGKSGTFHVFVHYDHDDIFHSTPVV